MRVVTVNVNGIRSALAKGFWPWLLRQKADVVCLQEMRVTEADLPEPVRSARGWHAVHHYAERPGYSGVTLLCRRPPDRVTVGLGWRDMDREGRYVQADFGRLSVASLYVPSGSSGEERQQVKYGFLERFEERWRRERRRGRQWLLAGDFNIAHREIDLKNWRGNRNNSGFLPEERAFMDRLFSDMGYHDAFRVLDPRPDQYTWWSNRGQAYAKNVGWRIDYQVVTPGLAEAARATSIYKGGKFSDHAPLTVDYDLDL